MDCGKCSSDVQIENVREKYDIALGDHIKMDVICPGCDEKRGGIAIHDEGLDVKGQLDTSDDDTIEATDLEMADIPTDHLDFDIQDEETDDVVRIIFDPAEIKRCTLHTAQA